MARTQVAEPTVEVQPVEVQPEVAAPAVVLTVAEPQAAVTVVAPTTKNAKVKGTWTMYYGTFRGDFVDGHRYDLPLDVYEYLRQSGSIYDTI